MQAEVVSERVGDVQSIRQRKRIGCCCEWGGRRRVVFFGNGMVGVFFGGLNGVIFSRMRVWFSILSDCGAGIVSKYAVASVFEP